MDDDLTDLLDKVPANRAVEKLISMPPALLEAIMEDPKEMAMLSRAWAAHGMHQIMTNFHMYSPAQKLQAVELSAKMGDLFPQKNVAQIAEGAGFQVVINLTEAPKSVAPTKKEITVEHTPE